MKARTERYIRLELLQDMDIQDFWDNGNGPDCIVTTDSHGLTVKIDKEDTNRIQLLNNLFRSKQHGCKC